MGVVRLMSNTRFAIAAAVLLGVLGAEAQSATWVEVASDGNAYYFADLSGIKIISDIRHVWIKRNFKLPPRQTRVEGVYVVYQVERNAFNCAEGTRVMEAATTYLEDGREIGGSRGPTNPWEWELVEPDTAFDRVMTFVCKYKP